MEELANFLREKFGNDVKIITIPHDRVTPKEIDWIPETTEQFFEIVNNAPAHILKSLGFVKFENMNDLIKENQIMAPKHDIEIPIINSTDIYKVSVGLENNYPTELLNENEDVWLIPGDWFDIIPENFIYTGLYGQKEPFIKEKASDDTRFGCLAYAITRRQNEEM